MEGGAWTPIDPAKTYLVATNNYVRQGGDGYKVFADNAKNAYDYGPGLEQVVADYLAAHRPYTPKLDGRITEIAARCRGDPPSRAGRAAPAEAGRAGCRAPPANRRGSRPRRPNPRACHRRRRHLLGSRREGLWRRRPSGRRSPTPIRRTGRAHLPIGATLTIPPAA